MTLSGLGNVETYGVIQYLLDGATGPAGRPVSSFTFALQYQQWPDHPFYFKLVNLIIHLVNGCLVYFLSCFVFKKLNSEKPDSTVFQKGNLFAFMVTALWLLHPMQATTVLYVVQRMTQLSALFTLLGLLGYLIYREKYETSKNIKELLVMSIVVCFFTVSGVLAKENGILLPLYLLVAEVTLYGRSSRTTMFKYWASLFLILPLLIFGVYLLLYFDRHLADYSYRTFTMVERLFTQPVVLVHYLSDLLLPQFKTFTLFHDDFPVSRTIFNPPLTIISMLVCAVLLLTAISRIKTWSMLSFGLLWFFAGHLLEASHIGLELYFEHRNYLPSLGIFILMVWLLKKTTEFVNKKIIFAIAIIYFSLLSLTTYQQARTWADPLQQAVVWQNTHPTSLRAMANLLNTNLKYGRIEEAKKMHDGLSELMPDDAYLFIKDVTIAYCNEEKPLADAVWNEILTAAQVAKNTKISGSMALIEMNNLLTNVEKGHCLPANIPRFALLAIVLAQNPEFKSIRGQLHQIAAFMLLQAGDISAALANIDEALKVQKSPTRFYLKFQLLMARKNWTEARQVLVEFDDYLKHNMKKNLSYRKILNDMTGELDDHIQTMH